MLVWVKSPQEPQDTDGLAGRKAGWKSAQKGHFRAGQYLPTHPNPSRASFVLYIYLKINLGTLYRPYLSPGALVLLGLQEVQQHLQESGILPIRFHHVACAGHQLAQSPEGHLEEIHKVD